MVFCRGPQVSIRRGVSQVSLYVGMANGGFLPVMETREYGSDSTSNKNADDRDVVKQVHVLRLMISHNRRVVQVDLPKFIYNA